MSRYSPKFKRRQDGITNYKKRFNMLKSQLPRVVMRITNKKIIAHASVFDQNGDKTTAFIDSARLKALGWKHSVKSIPAAYLTGALMASVMKEKGQNDCIIDLGLRTNTKGSRIYAALKGAADAGLKFPHSPDYFPVEDRISGKHIDAYRKTDVSKDFGEFKSKLLSGSMKLPAKKEKAVKEKKEKPVKAKAVKEVKKND
ncbi:50S ribosomal protein L18 [uncultured archaeon]|nr:50S ribosomal protein L18 [uncultured archaeon]